LLAEDYRRRFPEQLVSLAFLELMPPTLPQVLAELAGRGVGTVRVVPLFLAPGAHTRRDLPALVAQARLDWPALGPAVRRALKNSFTYIFSS
jgi:sirohydrochlorin cobaltochelatase